MIKVKLSKILGDRRINQSELSRISGIRYPTINAIYNESITKIGLNTIDKICRSLSITPGDLFEYLPDPRKEGESDG